MLVLVRPGQMGSVEKHQGNGHPPDSDESAAPQRYLRSPSQPAATQVRSPEDLALLELSCVHFRSLASDRGLEWLGL